MRYSYLILLLLALAPLAGCGETVTRTIVVTATPGPPTPNPVTSRPTAQTPRSSPAAFTLTLSDVGQAFTQTAAAAHSNAQVAATYHLSAAGLRRRGRLTSYETEFRQQQSTGILEVDDVVAWWRTPSGAQWDYRRVIGQILHSTPPPQGLQTLSAPRLGEVRRAIAFHASRQPANLVDYAFVFQRGRYRGYVQVVAVSGTIGDADAERLARIVDGRIRQATL